MEQKKKQNQTTEQKNTKPGPRQRRLAWKAAKDRFSRAAAVLFIVALAAVPVAGYFLPDNSFSAEENRMLREWPGISVTEYFEGRAERKLESYVEDQFPLRNGFIRMKSAMDMTAGMLESNDVIKCEDHYLMEEIKTPDAANLERTVAALAAFRERYPKVRMYFLLAPNAANILAAKLPATGRMEDQARSRDAVFAAGSEAGITPIDVRDAFRANKDDVQLYYRTDHHWTSDGAYLAYQTACEVMGLGKPAEYTARVVKNDFNGTLYSRSGYTNGLSDEIKIYTMTDEDAWQPSVIYYADTKEKTTEFFRLDNLETKDAYSVFGGSNHPMYTIKTPVEINRRLLIIKDSYANSFIPFIPQYYREVVVVDPRYYFENIDDLMTSEGVTDVLFLYNANTFFLDESLAMTLVDER